MAYRIVQRFAGGTEDPYASSISAVHPGSRAASLDQQALFQDLLEDLEMNLDILPDKGEENPQNTLRALWLTVTGRPVSPIASEGRVLPELSPFQATRLKGLVASRLSGVPLAHLTGRQDFMGLDFLLHKGSYIPRKDTELLARTALARIAEDCADAPEVKVIDVCTGIGTVALAIAHYCTKAKVFGSDIFSPAIQAARINAQRFGLTERSTFYNSDLFEPFEQCSLKNQADLIVSAPPYISSGKVKHMAPEIAQHEPEEAFDAGPFGVSIFLSLISTGVEYLRPDGHLIMECGQGQGAFIGKRLATNGHYGDVAEVRDAHGDVRVVCARRVS